MDLMFHFILLQSNILPGNTSQKSKSYLEKIIKIYSFLVMFCLIVGLGKKFKKINEPDENSKPLSKRCTSNMPLLGTT